MVNLATKFEFSIEPSRNEDMKDDAKCWNGFWFL